MLLGVPPRMPCAAPKDEIPTEEFPHIYNVSIEVSLIEVTRALLSQAKRANFTIDGAEGPLTGWCLVRTSSQWSGPGLRRMHRLLIKKLPRLSLTTRGP